MSEINKFSEKILNDYCKTRVRNKKKLDEKINDLSKNLKGFKEIEDKIIDLNIKKTINFSNDENLMKSLNNKINNLINDKTNLLKENGYPLNYLEMEYECDKCMDTGYINEKYCECFNKKLGELLYNNENLGNILDLESFENFKLDYYSDESKNGEESPRSIIKNVLEISKDFSKNYKKTNKNIILTGDSGLGKTFLCHAICGYALKNGGECLYLMASEVFDIMGGKFRGSDEVFREKIKAVEEVELLIIDDLGTELYTEFTNSSLFEIINKRLLNKKSTVISTNLSIMRIKERYGERIQSRFIDNYEYLLLKGKDIRLQKKVMMFK